MKLKEKKVFLLDMDGTFYLGNTLIPGALEFIKTLDQENKSYYFLTNNSSRNANFYHHKLVRMGLQLHRGQIITSGEVCGWFLNQIIPQGRIFLLGTPYLEQELLRANLISVQENPDFVVLVFDTTLSFQIRKSLSIYPPGDSLLCDSSRYQLSHQSWSYP